MPAPRRLARPAAGPASCRALSSAGSRRFSGGPCRKLPTGGVAVALCPTRELRLIASMRRAEADARGALRAFVTERMSRSPTWMTRQRSVARAPSRKPWNRDQDQLARTAIGAPSSSGAPRRSRRVARLFAASCASAAIRSLQQIAAMSWQTPRPPRATSTRFPHAGTPPILVVTPTLPRERGTLAAALLRVMSNVPSHPTTGPYLPTPMTSMPPMPPESFASRRAAAGNCRRRRNPARRRLQWMAGLGQRLPPRRGPSCVGPATRDVAANLRPSRRQELLRVPAHRRHRDGFPISRVPPPSATEFKLKEMEPRVTFENPAHAPQRILYGGREHLRRDRRQRGGKRAARSGASPPHARSLKKEAPRKRKRRARRGMPCAAPRARAPACPGHVVRDSAFPPWKHAPARRASRRCHSRRYAGQPVDSG